MSEGTVSKEKDRFQQVYERDGWTFGSDPSREMIEFLQKHPRQGEALDLGAGLGRDTIAMAKLGLRVLAIDLSEAGLKKLMRRAEDASVGSLIKTRVADFRELDLEPGRFTAIVGATALDHISVDDGKVLFPKWVRALRQDGVIYLEVHTIEDPGFTGRGPASECAGAIAHYFKPNELLEWGQQHLRVIRYEERLEWDQTHGTPHAHGKAILLGIKMGVVLKFDDRTDR